MAPSDLHRPTLVTLVPQSGIQIIARPVDLSDLGIQSVAFQEVARPDLPAPAGKVQVQLKRLTAPELEALRDPQRNLPPDAYTVRVEDALASFRGGWVPLPYLKIRSADAGGVLTFESGPSNWARIRLEPDASAGGAESGRYQALLAFDTAFVPPVAGGPYVGLVAEEGEPEFALCTNFEVASWFVEQRWVDGWVEEMYVEQREAELERKLTPKDRRNAHVYRARYLVFLELLARSRALPRFRLIDVISKNLPYTPVDVDLVLDIGNARTCGVLVESHGGNQGAGINLNESYPLRLRDLSAPDRVYEEPFESRVEFARPVFGRDAWSRRGGRASAFVWPSPVRVGPEAIRLSAIAPGNGGPTGLSSPKRYLWDDRPAEQLWRFNVPASEAQLEPPVSGNFMKYLREDGEVLGEGYEGVSAGRPRFSRSSLFTLMLVELLLQAITQINAPDTRTGRYAPDVPRRLRSVILTMPPAMPLAEQRLLRRRAEGAVRLVWDLQTWTDGAHAPRPPKVVADLDEASATQLVFLYTEVTQRLKGNVDWFLSLSGRERGPGVRSVRIASVDIGGGTTDLMVSTYTSEPGDALIPVQNFREGFKIAGDDVLREVIEAIVIPQLRTALKTAGQADPVEFLRDFFAGDRGKETTLERYLRLQVVARVLEPVGTAVLSADERLVEDERGEILRGRVVDFLGNPQLAARAIAHFDAEAHAAGAAPGFSLANVEVVAGSANVAEAVRVVLGDMLADLCEAVHAMGCDWLLLSGRPSRLRAVRDIILARLPVPVHRIVHMHRYEVGGWYPFRDSSGRIADPKTSAAVGAMLATVCEGRLEGFFLQSSRLVMRSTARYFGRLNRDNQLLPENHLIEQLDLDTKTRQREVLKALPFQQPMFLGFKQLPLRRWPATPLYWLGWTNPDDVPNYKLPLRVTLRRDEIDAEDRQGADAATRRRRELQREDFTVHMVEDRDREELDVRIVQFRLQTMTQETYWRDTGALTVEKS